MSSVSIDRNISRQRLMQMLGRRQTAACDTKAAASDAPLLDWTCPHHFDSQGWVRMKELGDQIASSIETALGPMCQESPKVTLKKVVQDYACKAAERAETGDKPQYFLPFLSQAKRAEGFLCVPLEAAGVLIAQVLRDPEASAGQSGSFSSLEESILQDAMAGLLDVVTAALQAGGQASLKRADRIVVGQWPLDARDMQDLCGFSFTVAFAKQSIEIHMMAAAEILDAALQITFRTQKPMTPAEQSKKIIRLLHDVPVRITAQLSMSSIRVEDLVTMDPGDVLVTDKRTNEPLDILVNGLFCFRAWPALCEGKFSLVVAPVKKIN
jgi:flagellar motor switch/type III secretory pathway protein FliN